MRTLRRHNRMMALIQELNSRMMELELVLNSRMMELVLNSHMMELVLNSCMMELVLNNRSLELDCIEVLELGSKLVLLEHSNCWPSMHGALRAIRRRIRKPCLREAWPKCLADRRNLPLQRIRS